MAHEELGANTVKAILDGDLDDFHEHISGALKMRQQMLARVKSVDLKPGDRFYIKNVSPKYLDGQLVEYIEHRNGKAPIRAKLVYGVRNYPAGYTLLLLESHIGRAAG